MNPDVKTIAVLGAGTMGHGIAQLAAMAGYEVYLRDVEQRFLDKGLEKIRWSLEKLREKKTIDEDKARSALLRLKTTLDLREAVKEADVVIEAIPEIMELKKQTFQEIDGYAPPHTIFATNTSTMPVTEIAAATHRPERVIGMHYFNPPQLMPLVELIRGEKTSDETVKLTEELARKFGKETVLCKKDVPGFIVNRILGPFVNEGAWLIHRKEASVLEIDSAVKYRLGLPMGLFEVVDYSGIDVIYNVLKFFEERGLVKEYPPVWKELVDQGRLGAKTGKGFHEWGGGYQRPKIPMEPGQAFDTKRLLAPAINAAAELVMLDIASTQDVDKAVKMGLGFPKGIFEMADEMGVDVVVDLLKGLQAKYGDFYRPQTLLLDHVAKGWLGKKAGKGFYTYEHAEKQYQTILVRKEVDDRLAWLILNRPHRLNTFTDEVRAEIAHALDELEADEAVRVIIITGAGEKAFSAGADITSFQTISPGQAGDLAKKGQDVFKRVENYPKPVIAAIRGYALGGGCELALACDFRIASDTAQLGQPEINLGLIPGWGGTQRLVRLVGLAKAKELILLGDRIPAEEAYRIGLVHRVVPDREFETEVRRFAGRLAAGPPIALKLAKRVMNIAAEEGGQAGFDAEALAFANIANTEDLAEGVISFLSKKKPEFKGR